MADEPSRTVGFHDDQLHRITGRARQPARTTQEVAAELLGAEGLTEKASTFDRRDVTRAWCDRLPAGATAVHAEQLTDWILSADNPHLVRLDSPGDNPRGTIRELLTIEQRAIHTATSRQNARVGILTPPQSR